jgi:glycosyltransferase involved in cell wall biosynthesis
MTQETCTRREAEYLQGIPDANVRSGKPGTARRDLLPGLTFLHRTALRVADRVRFSRFLAESLAFLFYAVYVVLRGRRPDRKGAADMRLLFRAARLTRHPGLRARIRARLSPWIASTRASGRAPAVPGMQAIPAPAVIVLKAPGAAGEKGVLFAGNETAWPAVAHVAARTDLLASYDFVGLSAWSPPKYQKLAAFVGLSDDPIHIGISNPDDLAAYALLAPAIAPLPLMASDWVNPDDFRPRARAERDNDILMVAGWGRYKRHWLLFEALRGLPADLSVVLIGADSGGRTARHVRTEARRFGVRQDLMFLTGLPVHEVNDFQSRARIAVVFSAREGACVAVTESLFADTPVGLMADAHVGSKSHINPQTGVLFARSRLPRQLGEFLDVSDRFRPRAWAEANISCHRSSEKLNQHLREAALDSGRPWTTNIVPLFRRYFRPHHLHPAHRAELEAAYHQLSNLYGLVLDPH